MSGKRKLYVKIGSYLIFGIISICFITACQPASGQKNDSSAALIKSVQDAGISAGEIKLVGTITNVKGEILEQYEDDRFRYTITPDRANILNAMLIDYNELSLSLGENDMLPEAELVERGNAISRMLYPYMDWESGNVVVTAHPRADDGEGTVSIMSFMIEERSGNTLISSNSFEVYGDGTLTVFTREQNDPGIFHLDSHISMDTAKRIAFDAMMAHKSEREASSGSELFGEAIEDFDFLFVEQRKHDGNAAWFVEIAPKTSWGILNENGLGIYIGAETGEILYKYIT